MKIIYEFTLKTTNHTNCVHLISIQSIREISGQRLFRADSFIEIGKHIKQAELQITNSYNYNKLCVAEVLAQLCKASTVSPLPLRSKRLKPNAETVKGFSLLK